MAALVAMCDAYFGTLLDFFDRHDLWADTALILTTDHGLLLSEHDWWGKNLQPYYREISHIPLIVHDPRQPGAAGSRRNRITQTHDLMPTLLDLFDAPVPEEVQGTSVLAPDGPDLAVFSMFGGPIGITDGEYDLYLYPKDINAPGLREYTLMPTHIRSRMEPKELATAELDRSFSFTKGAPLMRIDALTDARRIPLIDGKQLFDCGTQLFHSREDPAQQSPIRDASIEARLLDGLLDVLRAHETPPEFYAWFGLESAGQAQPATKASI